MPIAYTDISMNGYRPLSEMSGRELEDAAYAIGVQRSLPKPLRVEKWQRWRDSKGGEFVVAGPSDEYHGNGVYPLRKEGADGKWWGNNLLGGKNWTFLGYAKPPIVEVGQKWREFGAVYTVIGLRADVANMRSSAVGVPDDAVPCDTMTRLDRWEYLGMAESASAEEVAIRKCAIANGQTAGAIRGAVNDIKMRFEIDPSWKAPAAQTSQTAEQAKQDARRANEEAAKRLIANPPEWAYPKAWMCAVLAMAEMGGRGLGVMTPDMQGYDMLQTYHHRRAIQGMTHAEATTRVIGDALKVVDAYARGMERPSPLMGRQGIKRGISTCDLGAEYE